MKPDPFGFQGRYQAVPVDHGSDAYFRLASTYIHLNPARARLIRIGEEPLWGYRWSSYPAYLGRASDRPRWLETRRVPGQRIPMLWVGRTKRVGVQAMPKACQPVAEVASTSGYESEMAMTPNGVAEPRERAGVSVRCDGRWRGSP